MYYIYKIENMINHKKYIGLTNNIASSNTFYSILNGISYKDYSLTYQKLTPTEKEQLASLLRN